MEDTADRAIAIVGAGAVLPDATNVAAFWENVKKHPLQYHRSNAKPLDIALYYDPDHSAPNKTYSKIGGLGKRARLGTHAMASRDSTAGGQCHGQSPKMGDLLHARSPGRLRLSQANAGSGSNGRDPRKLDGRRRHYLTSGHCLSRVCEGVGRIRQFRSFAGGAAARHPARI